MILSIKKIAMSVVVTAAMVLSGVGLAGTPVFADAAQDQVCKGVGKIFTENGDCVDEGAVDNVWAMAREVINWILIVAGIVAVGFIIFAGIRYVTSGGNADKVKKAKDTLLYAIIGLLIAALALVIVNLVLSVGNNVGGAGV